MMPHEISRFRPGACTEIKKIRDNYYVYMYEAVLLYSGKWEKKTGKAIGKIVPEKGFIPNRNYHLFSGEEDKDDITILESLIEVVCSDMKEYFEKYFGLNRGSPADFDNLNEEGLVFILLITAQRYSSLNNVAKGLANKAISTQDIFNMARRLKMERKGNTWTAAIRERKTSRCWRRSASSRFQSLPRKLELSHIDKYLDLF